MTRSDYETFIRVFNEICSRREEICSHASKCLECPYFAFNCQVFKKDFVENTNFMSVINKVSNIIFAEQENRK